MDSDLDPGRAEHGIAHNGSDFGQRYANSADYSDRNEQESDPGVLMSKLCVPLTPCPDYRPKNIHELIETVALYSIYSLGPLESYVKQQIITDTFDKDACLALLKFYQFNEEYRNPYIVLWIFILSLCALPDNSFNLCLFIHPADAERTHIGDLINLHECLELAKYTKFWDLLYTTKAGNLPEAQSPDQTLADYINSTYPFFENRIREYIKSQVSSAFTSIRKSLIASFLNLSLDELADWAESHNWHESPDASDYYVISSETAVRSESRTIKTDLKFSQFMKVIGYSQLDWK